MLEEWSPAYTKTGYATCINPSNALILIQLVSTQENQ